MMLDAADTPPIITPWAMALEIKMALPSPANAGLVADQRKAVGLAMLEAVGNWRPTGRILVTLKRIGPGRFDSDNLQGALRAVRDEVAARLGMDDADPRIEWVYGQGVGRASVQITVVLK